MTSTGAFAFVITIVYTIDVPYFPMTTRTVSIREFRENMTKFLKEAQEKNVHFVVMRHTVPIAHVTPVEHSDSLEALAAEVARAR